MVRLLLWFGSLTHACTCSMHSSFILFHSVTRLLLFVLPMAFPLPVWFTSSHLLGCRHSTVSPVLRCCVSRLPLVLLHSPFLPVLLELLEPFVVFLLPFSTSAF